MVEKTEEGLFNILVNVKGIVTMEITARNLSIALLISLLGSAQAGIYKWVDEEGNVVYSQTPRPEAQPVKLPRSRPALPTVSPAVGSGEQNQASAQKVTARKADPLEGRYCRQAKRNAKLLRNANSDTVFVTRDRKLVKYNDQERLRRLKIAEKAVNAYCRDKQQAVEEQVASR